MNLQVGVKAAIKNANTVLLLQRRGYDDLDTTWDIPGGRINPQESLLDGLKRELFEEIGVKIDETPELVDAQDIFVESKDLHVVRLTYLISKSIDPITLSDEHSDYRHVSLDQLDAYNIDNITRQMLLRLVER
jgi:8-oxo-dGTP diphosphatase